MFTIISKINTWKNKTASVATIKWKYDADQNHPSHLLLMEALQFSKIMRILNVRLQNIPLRLYYVHLIN